MPRTQNGNVIGVRELKTHVSAVLREVCETGAEFIVSVHGRPVARLEPLAAERVAAGVDGMGNSRGVLGSLPSLVWDDFVAAKSIWRARLLDDE